MVTSHAPTSSCHPTSVGFQSRTSKGDANILAMTWPFVTPAGPHLCTAVALAPELPRWTQGWADSKLTWTLAALQPRCSSRECLYLEIQVAGARHHPLECLGVSGPGEHSVPTQQARLTGCSNLGFFPCGTSRSKTKLNWSVLKQFVKKYVDWCVWV